MLLSGLMILAGIALLAYAGARLIDFAAAVAERARLTPAVIGLTVVAAGTSAPELFVSTTAALRGSADIAIANVVGSNIANIALVLGACALIAVVPLDRKILGLEYPFMVFASWLALLLSRDGRLDRLESGFFLAAVLGFLAYSLHLAREEVRGSEQRELAELVPSGAGTLQRRPVAVLALGLAASLTGLAVGARLLVTGATAVAEALGVSERVIGLTIVAIGTSLPELVASLAAALKRQHQMAVTNIVGSNILNLLLILGVTGLIRPIRVSPRLVGVDMWVMMGVSLLLYPLVVRHGRLSRGGGALLLVGYALYLLLVARTG